MRQSLLLVILSFFVFLVPVVGDELPQVLQPNTTAYPAEEVTALIEALAPLEEILNDDRLGSRRTFAPDVWQSHDFAAYTAGRLSEFEYETMLVSRSDRPDAVLPDALHVWVLVGIPLEEQVAWVPVEATPEPGKPQQILGLIPSTRDEDGNIWFEESYVSFSEATGPPANLPPVAKMHAPFKIEANNKTTFRATSSYDPDGEIVLYCWDFGDGTTETAVTSTARHRYEEPGYYKVMLTVIDDCGASKTVSITRRVVFQKGCSMCGS